MQELIFIYNADSGWFNAVSDFAHKLISPSTYACSLCKITYGHMGMKKQWRQFIEQLPYHTTFLHKDEIKALSLPIPDVLPAILLREEGASPKVVMGAESLNQMKDIHTLQQQLEKRLGLAI